MNQELAKRVFEGLPRGLDDKSLVMALNNWGLNAEDYMWAVDYYKAINGTCYKDGYEAAKANKLVTNCPYPEDTPYEDEWLRGYHEWNDNNFGDIH